MRSSVSTIIRKKTESRFCGQTTINFHLDFKTNIDAAMASNNGTAPKNATGVFAGSLDKSGGNSNNNNVNNNAKVASQRDPKKVIPYWLHGMVFYIPAEDFEFHLTKLITFGAVSEWYAKDKARELKQAGQDRFTVTQDDLGSVEASPEPPSTKPPASANPDSIISKRNLVRSLSQPGGITVPRHSEPSVEMPAQPWRQTRMAWEQKKHDSLASDGE